MKLSNAVKNLTPWRPGQSGNPGGRPKLPEELRAIQSLTQLEICKLVSKYARMTKEQLEDVVEQKQTPVVELAIASIFAKCIENGDFTRLSFLLDRAIGKVPVAAETDDEIAARQELQSLSNQELMRLVTEKLPELTRT